MMVQLTKTVALLVLKKNKIQYLVLGSVSHGTDLSFSCSILHRSSRRYCQSLNILFAFLFFLSYFLKLELQGYLDYLNLSIYTLSFVIRTSILHTQI